MSRSPDQLDHLSIDQSLWHKELRSVSLHSDLSVKSWTSTHNVKVPPYGTTFLHHPREPGSVGQDLAYSSAIRWASISSGYDT